MLKKLKITKFKIFISLLILVVIIFGIYNIMWFRHIKKFDVFLNSEKLAEIKDTPSSAPEFLTIDGVEVPYSYSRYEYTHYPDGWKRHLYRDFDYNESGYTYNIVIPPYLKFWGHIQVFEQTAEYILSLSIIPTDWLYILSISDSPDETDEITTHFSSAVDKNGTRFLPKKHL